MNKKISIILPVYNEETCLKECLQSLLSQSPDVHEIIIIDDGSSDRTTKIASDMQQVNPKILLYHQDHQGPGIARNLGARHASGGILVFIDADMTCAPDFISKLISPIIEGKSFGTFTKEEYVSNWDNPWARCWNYIQGLSDSRRIPASYPLTSPVFRAIQKHEFDKVKGFDAIGYTDDWTLSRKLGYQATLASGAVCRHKNPSSFLEIYHHAQWIGKNEFICGTFFRRIYNLFWYFPLWQTLLGIYEALRYQEMFTIPSRFAYGVGISKSVLLSPSKKYHE